MENGRESAFTLFEVLLVLALSGLLCIGFLSFVVDGIALYYSLSIRSETVHQLLTGLEAVSAGLQRAEPATIRFMGELGGERYAQIQFQRQFSPDVYWFYCNPEGKLIQAVKRPGEEWGRNSLAEGVETLSFSGTAAGEFILLHLEVTGDFQGKPLGFSTVISPGF